MATTYAYVIPCSSINKHSCCKISALQKIANEKYRNISLENISMNNKMLQEMLERTDIVLAENDELKTSLQKISDENIELKNKIENEKLLCSFVEKIKKNDDYIDMCNNISNTILIYDQFTPEFKKFITSTDRHRYLIVLINFMQYINTNSKENNFDSKYYHKFRNDINKFKSYSTDWEKVKTLITNVGLKYKLTYDNIWNLVINIFNKRNRISHNIEEDRLTIKNITNGIAFGTINKDAIILAQTFNICK